MVQASKDKRSVGEMHGRCGTGELDASIMH
jgi:hypothetical protein